MNNFKKNIHKKISILSVNYVIELGEVIKFGI